MNVYKVSSWLKILAWLLLAALFVKMLAMVRPDERLISDRFAGRGRNLAIMRNVQPGEWDSPDQLMAVKYNRVNPNL